MREGGILASGIAVVLGVIVLNLLLLAGVVWVIVFVLQHMGVI